MPTTLDDVREIARSFLGIEEGTSYGTPAFRASKKFFSRLHDNPEWFVLKVGELEQAFLIETEPEIYHLTNHYIGTSLVLIRLSAITLQGFLCRVHVCVAACRLSTRSGGV